MHNVPGVQLLHADCDVLDHLEHLVVLQPDLADMDYVLQTAVVHVLTHDTPLFVRLVGTHLQQDVRVPQLTHHVQFPQELFVLKYFVHHDVVSLQNRLLVVFFGFVRLFHFLLLFGFEYFDSYMLVKV